MWWSILALLSAATTTDVRLEVEHDGALVLGKTTSVPIRIYAPEDTENQDRPLQASVNVGHLEAIERIAPGEYQSIYVLPETRHPQVAFVAVWRETGPDAPVAFLRIPLLGRTTLPVGTQRGAQVEVSFQDVTFGPVQADRRGRAQIPIEIPPGVQSVLVRSRTDKQEFQKRVPVAVPPYNRMTLAVTPYRIEADGESFAIAHVFYEIDPPAPLKHIRVRAEGGTMTPLNQDGNRYRFRFQPERGSKSQSVMLTARAKRDRTSRAKVELSLGAPIPQRIVFQGAEAVVADGRSTAPVRFLVTDRLGLGVPKLDLNVKASHGMIEELEDLGQGVYQANLQGPEQYPPNGTLTVEATVPTDESLSAAASVLVTPPPWPGSANISLNPAIPIADGQTPCTIEIDVEDAAGQAFTLGGLKLFVDDIQTPLEEIEPGRYRAEIVPSVERNPIALSVEHISGQFRQVQTAPTRPPPEFIFAGAGVGGVYRQAMSWALTTEAGTVLPILDRRGRLSARLSFAETQRDFPLEDSNQAIGSRLRTLSLALYATYDIALTADWRLYTGVGAGPMFFDHRSELDTFVEARSDVGLTGDGILGFSYWGGFAELQASLTSLSTDGFQGPRWGIGLIAGYRLGIL